MSRDTLLIELGTEELPPKSLSVLISAFSKEMVNGLLEAEIITSEQAAQAKSFATPRRLAISVPEVQSAQPDQQIERRGPAIQAAFNDDGEPTQAALGFAKSCAVDIGDLERLKTDKGEWLSYQVEQKGKQIDELVPDILELAIKRLPIAKRMRWGAGQAEFVRPIQWLIVMHGKNVLDTNILGIDSANTTRGHRFHSTGNLPVKNADQYLSVLSEQGNVVANFDERRSMIQQQITHLAKSVSGNIEDDSALLNEVTGLVEYPTSVLGSFDENFLQVPQECLISAMRDHQKYFHIVDNDGKLLPNFITVSNIQSKDDQRVVVGNERVLRARLSDAQFFWQTDLKTKLESRVEQLDNVLFHVKLGSVLDKTKRLEALTAKISQRIDADSKIATRAAALAKADLLSDMVGEFDKLQGLMGRYYAQNDGESALVSECIEQHYWPKFAGDQLPTSAEAQSLALADRLDSLVGLFASKEIPTGDKDPYGLRRAALSILRILIEHDHDLALSDLIQDSAEVYKSKQNIKIDTDIQVQILEFIRGRLTAHYQNQEIPTTVINAVMACKPESPLDFDKRVNAVNQFSSLAEAQDLAAANKRIRNILKKQAKAPSGDIDKSLLSDDAEKVLYKTLAGLDTECLSLFEQGNYAEGLQKLASLRTPVDNFFESVMVMCEDEAVQQNRLSILAKMQQLFLHVADISLLQS